MLRISFPKLDLKSPLICKTGDQILLRWCKLAKWKWLRKVIWPLTHLFTFHPSQRLQGCSWNVWTTYTQSVLYTCRRTGEKLCFYNGALLFFPLKAALAHLESLAIDVEQAHPPATEDVIDSLPQITVLEDHYGTACSFPRRVYVRVRVRVRVRVPVRVRVCVSARVVGCRIVHTPVFMQSLCSHPLADALKYLLQKRFKVSFVPAAICLLNGR